LNVIVDESNSKNQSRREENNKEIVPSHVSDLVAGRRAVALFLYFIFKNDS